MKKGSEAYSPLTLRLKSGFTLIEVIVTLTILGFILVVIFEAFHLGLSAWEKGESKKEEYETTRIVSQLVSQQIKSMVPYKFKTQKAEGDYFAFDGKTNALRFVSSLSLKKKQSEGFVYVVYRYQEGRGEKGGQLVLYEQRALNKNFFEDDLKEESAVVLLEGIDDIRFEYFQEEDKLKNREEGWVEEWNAKETNEFPKAVKLTIFKKQEEDKGGAFPVRMMVSLPAYRYEALRATPFIHR